MNLVRIESYLILENKNGKKKILELRFLGKNNLENSTYFYIFYLPILQNFEYVYTYYCHLLAESLRSPRYFFEIFIYEIFFTISLFSRFTPWIELNTAVLQPTLYQV